MANLTPIQFQFTVNRVSDAWEDVELPYQSIVQIEDEFHNIVDFQAFIDVADPIRNLFLTRIRDIVSKNREEYMVASTQFQVISNTDNILHIKLSTRAVYGDPVKAEDHYILAEERWEHHKGSSTYQEGVPCIEDYVFELKFMER